MEALFESRNVPDILQEAYERASPIKSTEMSLYENVMAVQKQGQESFLGLINHLKGKVAELRLEDTLEEQRPGWEFTISARQNEPDVDLVGLGPNGEEVLIQVKARPADYAPEVVSALEGDPSVIYGVSTEIYEKIATSHPELLPNLVDVGSVEELTEEVSEGARDLARNMGIDVPDSLANLLPFAAEIVLGVRLITRLLGTEKELKGVNVDDRARVHGIRALTLISRYGVNQVLAAAGSAAGGTGASVLPGVGTAVGMAAGGAAGLGAGLLLNRSLQPRIQDVALRLVGGDADYLFYLMNKAAIDDLATSFAGTSAA